MLQLLERSWQPKLAELIADARESLLMAAPYIKFDAAAWLIDVIGGQGAIRPGETTVMTDLWPDSTLRSTLDISALLLFTDSLPRVSIFDVHDLHAKVYVADDKHAIITSGNLTSRALTTNYEYGVLVSDRDIVSRVRSDMRAYAKAGREVSRDELIRLQRVSREAARLYRRSAGRLDANLRGELAVEWDKISAEFGAPPGIHEAGSARFKGPIIAILASRGPLPTNDLCQTIQTLWPFLCDDSVMRVAKDGTRKRQWRHDIHTAQETLQRAGLLTRDTLGLWHLASSVGTPESLGGSRGRGLEL